MSIYQLKPAFQRLLRPLAAALAERGVRPNQVTLAALWLSLVVGALVALFPDVRALVLLIPVVLLLRMALNAIDGMMAREHGMASPLGAFLNELTDIVSDAALYLPFAILTDSRLVVLVVILAGVAETAGILGRTVGASRRYDGPAGKSDRALLFGLVAVVLALWTPPRALTEVVWALLLVLLALTVSRRIRGALGELP